MPETAKQIFWKPYERRDTNFMTPRVIGYYLIPDGAVELSVGDAFLSGGKLYGVTVTRKGQRDHEASKCLHSKAGALAYIHELQGDETC